MVLLDFSSARVHCRRHDIACAHTGARQAACQGDTTAAVAAPRLTRLLCHVCSGVRDDSAGTELGRTEALLGVSYCDLAPVRRLWARRRLWVLAAPQAGQGADTAKHPLTARHLFRVPRLVSAGRRLSRDGLLHASLVSGSQERFTYEQWLDAVADHDISDCCIHGVRLHE